MDRGDRGPSAAAGDGGQVWSLGTIIPGRMRVFGVRWCRNMLLSGGINRSTLVLLRTMPGIYRSRLREWKIYLLCLLISQSQVGWAAYLLLDFNELRCAKILICHISL
jgi:hypothetical protein